MEVVKDEVSWSSSTLASDPSCFASNEAEGQDKLLKATLMVKGMEEVDGGWGGIDRWNGQEDYEESIVFL